MRILHEAMKTLRLIIFLTPTFLLFAAMKSSSAPLDPRGGMNANVYVDDGGMWHGSSWYYTTTRPNTVVIGNLSRSVRDAARYYDVCAGVHPLPRAISPTRPTRPSRTTRSARPVSRRFATDWTARCKNGPSRSSAASSWLFRGSKSRVHHQVLFGALVRSHEELPGGNERHSLRAGRGRRRCPLSFP